MYKKYVEKRLDEPGTSELQKRIFKLRYEENYANEEIADALVISQNSI